MKIIFPVLVVIFSVLGCTHIEVEENLPSVSHLSPQQMETSLNRVNIVANQDSVNYMFRKHGHKINLSANIFFYDNQGQLKFEETGILDLRGTGSTSADMKPLGIIFTHKIDNAHHQIINTSQALTGDNLDVLQSIRLRNSGQDYGFTMIKDLAYTEFAISVGLDLEIKYGQPIHVFINGSYYGLHNIRNDFDLIALSDLLQTDVDAITILKMDVNNRNIEFRDGDESLFNRFHSAMENKELETLKELIDVENFMDYIIFEDYVANSDWPYNNLKLYSINGSKFRFLLFDLDYAGYRSNNPRLPEMEYLKDDLSKIYQIFYTQDDGFRERLKKKQLTWYAKFSPNKFHLIVDRLSQNIENEIPYLIQRRGVPASALHWNLYLEQIKSEFDQTDSSRRKKYGIQ